MTLHEIYTAIDAIFSVYGIDGNMPLQVECKLLDLHSRLLRAKPEILGVCRSLLFGGILFIQP